MFHNFVLLTLIAVAVAGSSSDYAYYYTYEDNDNDDNSYDSDTEEQILRGLQRNYNKFEPPRRDRPTEVKIGFHLLKVTVRNGEATVTMYLRQSWNDPRLAFNSSKISAFRVYLWDKIWVPDTFFRHDLYSFVHEQTVPNKFMRLNSTGDVWYVVKLSAKFPMIQTTEGELMIRMMAESFGYTMDTMYFSSQDHPLGFETTEFVYDIPIVEANLNDCSTNYTVGSFSCLQLELIMS